MFNVYLEVITGDGQKITLSSHFSENSKKSILINHGMAEHQRRYKEFINFLNLNGINVFIYDHRGHGNRITASISSGVTSAFSIASLPAMTPISANIDNSSISLAGISGFI